MRRHPGLLALSALSLVLAPLLTSTSCSSGPATKAEFVDHAVEISNVSGDGEALLRKAFECVYPEVAKDEALLEEFMDNDEPTGDTAVGQRISTLMTPCLTSTATSTATGS